MFYTRLSGYYQKDGGGRSTGTICNLNLFRARNRDVRDLQLVYFPGFYRSCIVLRFTRLRRRLGGRRRGQYRCLGGIDGSLGDWFGGQGNGQRRYALW